MVYVLGPFCLEIPRGRPGAKCPLRTCLSSFALHVPRSLQEPHRLKTLNMCNSTCIIYIYIHKHNMIVCICASINDCTHVYVCEGVCALRAVFRLVTCKYLPRMIAQSRRLTLAAVNISSKPRRHKNLRRAYPDRILSPSLLWPYHP